MRQVITIDLNETWSEWLERYSPGMHSSLVVKGIVIDALNKFALTHPDLEKAVRESCPACISGSCAWLLYA